MDLVALRSFLAVVDAGSFRRAAAMLQLAQPSLTQHVKRLEHSLGVLLFDRSTRPVALTAAGSLLAERAPALIKSADDLQSEVSDHGDGKGGHIRLGAMQYLVHLDLPEALAAFRRARPSAGMHLRIGTSGDIVEMLDNGALDVGLLHLDSDLASTHFSSRVLRWEELVLIAPTHGALEGRTHVSWSELRDEPFITFRPEASLDRALRDQAARAGFTPRSAIESADIWASVALVAQNLGIALVPRSLAETVTSRVRIVTIGERDCHRSVALVWDSRRYQPAVARAFIEMIAESLSRKEELSG